MELDTASAAIQGARPYQEDSIAIRRPPDAAAGDAVPALLLVADGMGGHAAGDVASALAVEAAAELWPQSHGPIPERLWGLLDAANEAIADHVRAHPEHAGMGTTFIAAALTEAGLYHVSAGDSPLWRWRSVPPDDPPGAPADGTPGAGELTRLNEDHSRLPELRAAAARGELGGIAPEDHPERHVLCSALMGGPVPRVDLPAAPTPLARGDLVIAATDGLESLAETEIAALLARHGHAPAAALAERLIEAVGAKGLPEQDNASLVLARRLAPRLALRLAPRLDSPGRHASAEGPAPPGAPRARGGPARHGLRWLVFLALAAALLAGLALLMRAGMDSPRPVVPAPAAPAAPAE